LRRARDEAMQMGERQLGSLETLRDGMLGAFASLQAVRAQAGASIDGLVAWLTQNTGVPGSTVTGGNTTGVQSLIADLQSGVTDAGSVVGRFEAYLANNPDVAAAVARGDFGDPSAAISGAIAHYNMYGAAEGRVLHDG